jgi:P-type Na+/K+ transporter
MSVEVFAYCRLGLEPAAHDVMGRPPHNVISGVFNKEFASDIIVYGIIMGAAPLIVVYVVGNGNLGVSCNHGMNVSCEPVYRARSAVFASLTVLILLHAFEMKHPRQSIFTMDLLANKPLFISVVGGCLALFPTIYIPQLNDVVFRMTSITWEWGLCAASIVFYIVCVEGYKALKRRFWRKMDGIVVIGGKSSPGTELSRNTTVETLK